MCQESLGKLLRLERFKRNMTQVQVCREISMKVRTLSQIENGKGNHFKSTIQKLMIYYNLDPKDWKPPNEE